MLTIQIQNSIFSNIMDSSWSFNPLFWCITILLPTFLLFLRRRKNPRRPPGPPGWPIFGNMFDLGEMPHKTITGMRKTYGPVLWLRIGAINTMALQTSKAAAELFKNHDITFVERTVTDVMKCHDFHKGSVSLAPYGQYWRVMKRMITVEMVVNKRINETVSLRRKAVDELIAWVKKEAINAGEDTQGIQLSRYVFLTSFNMLGNLMFSRDLVNPESEEGSEFFVAMNTITEMGGQPNIVDIFPWLRWLDPQGLRRKMDKDMEKTSQIVSKFVKECVNERQESGVKKKDYLELLMEFEGDGKELFKISDHDLNIVIMEIFLAGSETTSGSVEWAMVELLSNPATLATLKAELEEVVGSHRQVQETDIDNLKYLQAVIKETLRLHPPIPFLVPRRATKDTQFMGFDIPKDTQVFVNVHAIGRDPETWEDPESFKPERFLGSKIEYKGQHYELIPFGAGRRICAGIPLAQRMLNIVLGSLVHEFDWEVHDSVAYKLRDKRERVGVVVRKIEPLIVIPRLKALTNTNN